MKEDVAARHTAITKQAKHRDGVHHDLLQHQPPLILNRFAPPSHELLIVGHVAELTG